MILKLRGSTFAVTGALDHFTRASAHKAIKDGGGKVAKSVTSTTSALVAGGRAGSKIDQARSRGAIILNEAQFQQLLKDGEIEVIEEGDEPVDEVISFRDAIAELRGALDGHPTSDKWTRIVYALDACDPALIDEAVAYVEGYLSQWDGREMGRWVPYGEHDRDDALEHYQKYMRERMSWNWLGGAPANELRLAPPHWTQDMVQGIDSPKFRTVRALNFNEMRVNTTMLNKMLGLAELKNVRLLNLGSGNKVSKTFFRKLRTTESFRTLEELWLYKLSEKEVDGIVGDALFDDFHTLRFVETYFYASSVIWRPLFTCDMTKNVRTLSFNWAVPEDAVSLLASDMSCLPSLETLEVRTYLENLRRIFDSGLATRLKGLILAQGYNGIDQIDEIIMHAHKLQDLELLCINRDERYPREDLSREIIQRADEFKRFPSLKRLEVGRYNTPKVREALSVLDGVEIVGEDVPG